MKKRLIALFLSCLMILTSAFSALANVDKMTMSSGKEVTTFGDTQLERVIGNSSVTVYIKDLNGNTLNTVKNISGTIYIDDVVVGQASNWTNMMIGSDVVPYATGTITWDAWEDFYPVTIETGGMSTAMVAAAISASAPWVGVRIAASLASVIAGAYEEVTIEGQIRYGVDEDNVMYYQRKTYVYGDGDLVGGPYTDTGVVD